MWDSIRSQPMLYDHVATSSRSFLLLVRRFSKAHSRASEHRHCARRSTNKLGEEKEKRREQRERRGDDHFLRFWFLLFRRGAAMDWQGQKVAEQLMQYLLLGSALLALIAGYFTSSYSTMLVVYLAGVVATLVVAVPNWPCFNRHPFHWLEPMYADVASVRQQKSKQQQVAAKKGVSKSQANKR